MSHYYQEVAAIALTTSERRVRFKIARQGSYDELMRPSVDWLRLGGEGLARTSQASGSPQIVHVLLLDPLQVHPSLQGPQA